MNFESDEAKTVAVKAKESSKKKAASECYGRANQSPAEPTFWILVTMPMLQFLRRLWEEKEDENNNFQVQFEDAPTWTILHRYDPI